MSGTIDALPSEILPLIFAYIRPNVRLHVLKHVCRRWRTAAMHSIKHSPRMPTVAALNRYPTLESINITEPFPDDAPLPLTLRTVMFLEHLPERCVCKRFISSSLSLTAVHVMMYANHACPAHLLSVHASSLRVLSLESAIPTEEGPTARGEYAAALLSLSLPSLTSLTLTLNSTDDLLRVTPMLPQFLRRLMPQLSAFYLVYYNRNAELLDQLLTFGDTVAPNLRKIRLRAARMSADSLKRLIRAAPNLTELHLTYFMALELRAVLTLVPQVLVSLDIQETTQSDMQACADLSKRCKKLQKLRIPNPVPEAVWMPHATRLRSLVLAGTTWSGLEAQITENCTALESLQLKHSFRPLQCMPNLRSLTFSCAGSQSWEDVVAYLDSTLPKCPSLLSITCERSPKGSDGLLKFLLKAQAHGVELFIAEGGERKLLALQQHLSSLRFAVVPFGLQRAFPLP